MTKKQAKPLKQMGKPRTLTSRDTDIYDNPGGEVIGILRAGRGGGILESNSDGWCKLMSLPPDPDSGFAGGTGWVWLGEKAGCG
jgi:hypothetical protein